MDALKVFTLITLRGGAPDCSVHMTREAAEQAFVALLHDALGEAVGEPPPGLRRWALRDRLARAGVDLAWTIAEKPLAGPDWFRALLDLSSAHVTLETVEMLREGRFDMPSMFVNEYGFFIYAPEDREHLRKLALPTDLVACMKKTRAVGCDYFMIDGDGLFVEGLRAYEW